MASSEETGAIRRFCKAKRKFDTTTEPLRSLKKNATKTKKHTRDELYKKLKASGHTCVSVGDDNFLRIRTYTNRKAVSTAIILDALANITTPQMQLRLQAGGSVGDSLVQCVVDNVARARTTTREYVAITKSKPRQCGVITPADNEISDLIVSYRSAEEDVKKANKTLVLYEKPLQEHMNRERDLVGQYMRRTMASSQRIHVSRGGGVVQTYFIRRKLTNRRQQPSVEQLGDMIRDVVIDRVNNHNGLTEALETIRTTASDIAAGVMQKLNDMPRIVSERITLDKGALKQETT